MFTLDQLEQLCALDQYQTFTAAAAALHISQPSLSRSMQHLESELGVCLFERARNRASLNANGKAAVKMAQAILDQCHQMKTDLAALDLANRKASLASCAPLPLELLADKIAREYPDWKVQTQMDERENLKAGLDTGLYDAIILDAPLKESRFFCRPLMQESLFVIVDKSHPLADRDEIYLREMNGQTMLLVQNIGIWQDLVDQQMPNAHFLIQQDRAALEILRRESTLPYFVTEPLGGMADPKRKKIRILDDQAVKTFYLCAREEGRARLNFLFSRADLFFHFDDSNTNQHG